MSLRRTMFVAATLCAGIATCAPHAAAEDIKKEIIGNYAKIDAGLDAKNLQPFMLLHSGDFEATYKGKSFKIAGLQQFVGMMVIIGKSISSKTVVTSCAGAGSTAHASAKQHINIVAIDPRQKQPTPIKAVIDFVTHDTWVPRQKLWKIRKSTFTTIKVVIDGKPLDIDAMVAQIAKRQKLMDERAAAAKQHPHKMAPKPVAP